MDNKVLDEAVQKALVEWYHPRHSFQPDAMRAALLAAMPVLLGPVVAEWRDAANLLEFTAAEAESVGSIAAAEASERKAAVIRQCSDRIESLYAPDLGGGK